MSCPRYPVDEGGGSAVVRGHVRSFEDDSPVNGLNDAMHDCDPIPSIPRGLSQSTRERSLVPDHRRLSFRERSKPWHDPSACLE